MSNYKEELKKKIDNRHDSIEDKITRLIVGGTVLGAMIGFGGMLYGCSKMENPCKNAKEVIELNNFKFTDFGYELKEIVDKTQEKYIAVEDIQILFNEQEELSRRYNDLRKSDAVKKYY